MKLTKRTITFEIPLEEIELKGVCISVLNRVLSPLSFSVINTISGFLFEIPNIKLDRVEQELLEGFWYRHKIKTAVYVNDCRV